MICQKLPKIMWFQNGNPYTECNGPYHYILLPNPKEETITGRVWIGRYCYEKNLDNISAEWTFPLTTQGLADLVQCILDEELEFIDRTPKYAKYYTQDLY